MFTQPAQAAYTAIPDLTRETAKNNAQKLIALQGFRAFVKKRASKASKAEIDSLLDAYIAQEWLQ